ncbi:copper resistance D family protein [Alkalihalobacillus sp. TS-13]|uniref:copper resistance D family protein n=1 Tax=Alkalihalobacillus sp. TS-13 TaxID=2842455 RepID=UPI001C88CC4D|nr:CopD family protein [Alkalihalobacillus sp. TS-13]
MIIFFKGILYVAFSLLIGGMLLESIPKNHKPKVAVSKELLLWVIASIPILMFVQLLQIIQYLSESIGYLETFTSVLFTFSVGKAWLASLLIAGVLFLLVYKNNLKDTTFYARLGLFLSIVLASSYSFASHTASLYPVIGFIAHFLHVASIAGWIGVLLYVAWSSERDSDWVPFLNWFTPFSIGAVLILTGGGLLMNEIVAPQYVDSWILPYGQALVIKHLLLIPVFIYACVHGFYLKKMIHRKGSQHVKRSLQGEAILVIFVFSVTAYLSQQVPPHEVWRTMLQEQPSPLFLYFFDGTIDPQSVISFSITNEVLLWALGGIVMLVGTLFSIIRQFPVIVSVVLGLGTSGLYYLALMSGVV